MLNPINVKPVSNWKHKNVSGVLSGLLIILLSVSLVSSGFAQTAVQKYGALRVNGTKIVDKNGTPVTLRGMSLYWSQWMPRFYNYNTLKWLRDDWKITIVRAAMAVDAGGYATNPTAERDKIYAVIDACISLGIYVIVDFHAHEANNYLSQARTFFGDVSRKYGNTPNILYEPWNEPRDVSWASVIKPYHENVIDVIRANASNAVVICGTRFYSQEVGEATANPVNRSNVAYTLHFYANTHKQELRDKAQVAINNGKALYVTEYGTTDASADGYVNQAETNTWWSFLDNNGIGYCNWSVADVPESAAILYSGAGLDNWSSSQIKPSGTFVRNMLRAKAPDLSAGGACGTSNGFPICCNGSASDPDGDGWGWENNASCVVQSSSGSVANGTYRITARHSGLSLNVEGASTADGGNVIQWPYGGANNEKWFVQNLGGGVYSIKNVNSGRSLDVVNASTADGADINQWYYSGNNNQKWYIQSVGSGYYKIVSVNSNKCIDVYNANTAQGAAINQWTCNGNNNQSFTFAQLSTATSREGNLDEVAEGQELTVHPNPSSGSFTVTESGAFDYVIQNATGSVVEKGQGSDEVSVGKGLSSGVYILQVKSAKGSKQVKLLKN